MSQIEYDPEYYEFVSPQTIEIWVLWVYSTCLQLHFNISDITAMRDPRYSAKVLLTIFACWQLTNLLSDCSLALLVLDVLFVYPIVYSKKQEQIDAQWAKLEKWLDKFFEKLTFLNEEAGDNGKGGHLKEE